MTTTTPSTSSAAANVNIFNTLNAVSITSHDAREKAALHEQMLRLRREIALLSAQQVQALYAKWTSPLQNGWGESAGNEFSLRTVTILLTHLLLHDARLANESHLASTSSSSSAAPATNNDLPEPVLMFLSRADIVLRNAWDEDVQNVCTEQFDRVAREFTTLAEVAASKNWANYGVGTLLRALHHRLPPPLGEVHTNVLTPIHTDLLQLCLKSSKLGVANKIVECEAYDAVSFSSPAQTAEHFTNLGFTNLRNAGATANLKRERFKRGTEVAVDFQRFFYYSAVVRCACRRYEQAISSLVQCLSLPSRGFNAVHLSAYKKLVLLSLLVRGDRSAAQNLTTASGGVAPNLHLGKCGEPYEKFVVLYERGTDFAAMTEWAKTHASVFADDGNAGLVSACLAAATAHKAQRLTIAYVTLKLGDVVKELGATGGESDAIDLMLHLRRAGRIRPVLDEASGSVEFASRETYDPVEIERRIEEMERVCASLGRVDAAFATSRAYVGNLMAGPSSSSSASSATPSLVTGAPGGTVGTRRGGKGR